jgi:lipopolysaccharide assembly outer membrane protein LptD (OstA)
MEKQMKSFFSLVLRGCLLCTLVPSFSAYAADIEFSAEGISVSEDWVTTYLGDAVVRAPKDTPMYIEAKSSKKENKAEVHEGDVRITLGKTLITTDKATITRSAKGEIVIRMDKAQSKDL